MLIDQIRKLLIDRRQSWDFTLEAGRGETYADGVPTLYGHSEYEASSVLAGQPLRRWVWSWSTIEEAHAELAQAALALAGTAPVRFQYDDQFEGGGSSHIPIDQMISHLPDDTDY